MPHSTIEIDKTIVRGSSGIHWPGFTSIFLQESGKLWFAFSQCYKEEVTIFVILGT